MSTTIATMEVKVQMKGHAAGTLGWFKAMIDDAELVIRKTRDGKAGMFLHEKHNRKGEERKAHEGNIFICSPSSKTQEDEGYNFIAINNIEYIFVQSEGGSEQKYLFGEDVCFTDYQLTSSCREAVDKFIVDAVHQFANWFEAQ